MGTYLNLDNSGFAGIKNDVYIDKSGLISLTIDTPASKQVSFNVLIILSLSNIYPPPCPHNLLFLSKIPPCTLLICKVLLTKCCLQVLLLLQNL